MSDLANTMFPPERDVFAPRPAAPVAPTSPAPASTPQPVATSIAELMFPPGQDPFSPKPAAATQGESQAGKSSDPLQAQRSEPEAAPESPQATQTLSAAEVLFGSDAEREAFEKLNVNVEGMAPDNPSQYDISPPQGWQLEDTPEAEIELTAVREAFHAVELPQQMADDFVGHAIAAAGIPVTTTEAEVETNLATIYGSPARAAEKLGLARSLVAKAAIKMPSIYAYLNSNGLGNNMDLILKTIAKAEHLKKQGRL